jgi:hypothetical protein
MVAGDRLGAGRVERLSPAALEAAVDLNGCRRSADVHTRSQVPELAGLPVGGRAASNSSPVPTL